MDGQWQTDEALKLPMVPEAVIPSVTRRANKPTSFLQIPFSIVIIRVTCILSILTAAIAIAAPWYLMPPDRRLGAMWSASSRFYGMLYVTGVHMSPISWPIMQMNTCRAAKDLSLSSGNIGVLAKKLAIEAGNEAIYEYEAGRSSENAWLTYFQDFVPVSCGLWTPCLTVATDRCMAYRIVSVMGILAVLLLLVVIVIMLFICVLVGREIDATNIMDSYAKKQRATRTFVILTVAVGLQWITVTMYFSVMGSSFSKLRANSIYPMPHLYLGAYCAVVSNSFSFVAFAAAFFRFRNGGNRAPPPEAVVSPGRAVQADENEQNWSANDWEKWGDWWGAVEY